MPEAIANQTSIHYEIIGSGPPLLLLHGLGSSGRDWEEQIDRFSDDYTVITIDSPRNRRVRTVFRSLRTTLQKY